MKTSDFDYYLPEEQIAQTPVYPRDHSRLLVFDRESDKIYHEKFFDIKKYLKKGDLLVRNNTKVLPARLFATTLNGGKVEVLLLKRFNLTEWEVLVKPGKKAKPGYQFFFSDKLSATVTDVKEDGNRIIEFVCEGEFYSVLDEVGQTILYFLLFI